MSISQALIRAMNHILLSFGNLSIVKSLKVFKGHWPHVTPNSRARWCSKMKLTPLFDARVIQSTFKTVAIFKRKINKKTSVF